MRIEEKRLAARGQVEAKQRCSNMVLRWIGGVEIVEAWRRKETSRAVAVATMLDYQRAQRHTMSRTVEQSSIAVVGTGAD